MAPLARRVGMTSGQTWTVALGTLLGALLLGSSVPPVWERRGQVTPAAVAGDLPAAAPGAPPAIGGALTGLLPVAPAPPLDPVVAALPAGAPPFLPPALALPPAAPAGAPAAPPPAAGAAAPAPARPGGPAGPQELRVVESGYAATGPTPGLPADALPVGARTGSPTETSYVRLRGGGAVLALPLADDPGATVSPGDAVVRACRLLTDTWPAGRPQEPVPFDESDCVAGVLEGGVLRFDLGAFADRTSRTGFALAPDLREDSGTTLRTFRLALRTTSGDAP